MDNEINQFRGNYSFLSNFYETPILYRGFKFRNAEAAFQAMKCKTRNEILAFTLMDGSQAKQAGRQVDMRSDWDYVKIGFMTEIIRAKFHQNKILAGMLLNTGDSRLVEGNTWNDTFWGVNLNNGIGTNTLGRILMQIRYELRMNIE